MSDCNFFEYNKKNRREIIEKVKANEEKIINILAINKNEINIETKNITYIDISGLFGFDKIEIAISTIESIIRIFEKNNIKNCFFIFEKEYTRTIKENLYYLIDEVPQLEEKLNINIKINKSIVEISEEEFENLKKNITEKIYGNEKFKRRLIEEMRSFRVFNILGIQPILSIFVFGKPGIGKTETAKLIHNTLYKDEDIIKINFENYSDEHALSSLIGSPRGYIGSEQGELSEKISKSQAKVIIIDEFEKASKPIFNFFLQLLEEGKFTDSLGREYDLNQYLIIFTSNIDKNELNKKISPELFSRFSLFYKMIDLTNEEKEKYLRSRVDYIVELLKTKEIELSEQEIEEICSINIEKYDDLRKLNNDLKKSVAKKVYSKLHK